jgi:CRP-like cAMP-binding protein
VLFNEGDPPDALYVVLRGRVAIANKSFDGRESVVALMENGDLFGEMGMLDGLPRSAEGRALEPSEVLELGYGPARALLERRPELLWGVVRMLADRLRGMDEALADSVFLDVTGRTAKRLLELANGANEFLLPSRRRSWRAWSERLASGSTRPSPASSAWDGWSSRTGATASCNETGWSCGPVRSTRHPVDGMIRRRAG